MHHCKRVVTSTLKTKNCLDLWNMNNVQHQLKVCHVILVDKLPQGYCRSGHGPHLSCLALYVSLSHFTMWCSRSRASALLHKAKGSWPSNSRNLRVERRVIFVIVCFSSNLSIVQTVTRKTTLRHAVCIHSLFSVVLDGSRNCRVTKRGKSTSDTNK